MLRRETKMKKIISAVVLSSLMTASCNKDFIELTPISTVSVDQLYKTDNDFRDALTGAYRSLQNQYQNFWILQILMKNPRRVRGFFYARVGQVDWW